MANKLLRAIDVEEQYGFSRSALIQWENEGKLPPGTVTRTPGGQRRYTTSGLEQLVVSNMDEQKGTLPVQAAYTEFGSSALRKWGGSIYEERLRELRGREGRILFREMRLNDPVISAVFFAIGNALRQADWRVKPASDSAIDKEVAEFVHTCLYDMSWGFYDQFTFITEPMMEQGFSLLELVYKKRLGKMPPMYTNDPATSKYADGRIGWRKWAPRPAESLAPGNEWIFDNKGGIQGANQQPETGEKTRPIPIQKLLLYRTTVHPNNSPEGLPIHRSMYIPYYFSQNLAEIEGIGVERDLTGIPVMYLGEDCTISGPNSDYEIALDLVTNIRNDEQSGVVIPKAKMGAGASEGRGMLLELISTTGRRSHDTNQLIERYDKRKALAVLAQFIMLGMERVGSFALSKHQGDLFVLAVSAWLYNIADIVNRHAIPRLMEYNVFPNMSGMPEMVPGVLSVPDLTELSEYVNGLVDRQILTPDDELERHLRQLARLPAPPITITGAREEKRKLPLDKAALLTRRVSLAVDSLTKMGLLDQAETGEVMAPLKKALMDGINRAITSGELDEADDTEIDMETEDTDLDIDIE